MCPHSYNYCRRPFAGECMMRLSRSISFLGDLQNAEFNLKITWLLVMSQYTYPHRCYAECGCKTLTLQRGALKLKGKRAKSSS